MCSRYRSHVTRDAISKHYNLSGNRVQAVEQKSAIYPGNEALVVRISSDGDQETVAMSWGFVLLQKYKAPRRVFNTRDDKVGSAFWRGSVDERRCLIPATAFAEPDDAKPVKWHWFALKGEGEPPYSFAGIWRPYNGPVKKDGPSVQIDCFSMLTTLPNDLTAAINHERMPVIIRREDYAKWLSPETKKALELCKPYPASEMKRLPAVEKQDQ